MKDSNDVIENRTGDLPACSIVPRPITLPRNSQEIPRMVWNPKVHCHVHNSPPLFPILRSTNTVHTLTYHFRKLRFNIILLILYPHETFIRSRRSLSFSRYSPPVMEHDSPLPSSQKPSPLVPILSHTLKHYFIKFPFNIILLTPDRDGSIVRS
jgi:hypothetical protein